MKRLTTILEWPVNKNTAHAAGWLQEELQKAAKERDELQLKLQEARKLAEEWRDCAVELAENEGYDTSMWDGLPWEDDDETAQ